MNDDSTLSIVVLPVPVPPVTSTFSPPRTQADTRSATAGVSVPSSTRSSTCSGSRENLRIVSIGPSTESGGITAFTREPSASRASTIGDDSSMRRPTWPTMRSMTRRRWSSEKNRESVSTMTPLRSTKIGAVELTITSLTVGSARKRSIGPKPDHVVEDLVDEALALDRPTSGAVVAAMRSPISLAT